MDFDLESFFSVENVISAIFNGDPLYPDPEETQTLPPTRSLQGSQDASAAPISTPTLTSTAASSSTSIYSLGRIDRSESSPSSLSSQSGIDAHKQVRSNDMAPPPKLDKTPSANADNLSQLLLAPGMDMSSAIALSQTVKKNGKRSHEIAFGDDESSVHSPRHLCVDKAYQLPEKSLRDELVKLYFVHFHPFCPVIDEVEFMEIYNDVKDDEQLQRRIPLPLFHAMMNVAFGHLPSARLPSTPYKSIYEGQKAYFEKASILYRLRHTSDHLTLIKVALMLTYWSPFDSEYQVNSYWIDRAFYHARAIALWDPQGKSVASLRRNRIVWWCCLLRDRVVSLALRRPYRIHEAKTTWPFVTEADFGLEVMFPKFTTAKTKRTMIDSFIWFCKLSDIIRDIAVFHEKKRFDREWSGGLVGSTTILAEEIQVSKFDTQLSDWKEEFLKSNGEYIKSVVPGSPKMPNYLLIICDSLRATLYVPYIHCPAGSGQAVQRFQKVALHKIKTASSTIALQCSKLSQTSKVGEEFMIGISAWIALPMAVFKVLEEKDGDVSIETNCRYYKEFVPFLSALAVRFRPAKLLVDIMGESTSEILARSTKLGIGQKDAQRRLLSHYSEDASHSKDDEEAEILNVVAKMIDLRFSTDGST